MSKHALRVVGGTKPSTTWTMMKSPLSTNRSSRLSRAPRPTLRFNPFAWAKLLFLRDAGDTEIGGFGITQSDDLLLVEDVRLVQQQCTEISVRFGDEAVADFFDRQVDQGRHPSQFARIWVHTHPCDCAQPSVTDEETFARCFGRADWAVMFILARGGQTYARLRFNVGPGGDLEIPHEVDFSRPFDAARQDAWDQEYQEHVIEQQFPGDGQLLDDLEMEFLEWQNGACA